MPDPIAFLPGLLIALLAVVMVWFTIGTQRNVSRGNRLLAWLSDALPAFGPRTTLRWLGSSVAELRITQPRHPYRDATVMIVLEPRDLGAFWALARRRGRRDFLLMRLSLVRAPTVRADLVAQEAWTASHTRRDEPQPEMREDWTDASGKSVELRHDGRADLEALREHWTRLGRLSGGPWRISVRPTVPHLEIHLLAPDAERQDARELLDEVGRLARDIAPH
jgi:hypothetical protein